MDKDKYLSIETVTRVRRKLRTLSYRAQRRDSGGYGLLEPETLVSGERYADIVTSELENGMHAPVIDLDIPHEYVPSATPGHGHLYINIPMSKIQMQRLMQALRYSGVIEQGYYESYVRRGYSAVRLPWKKKQVVRPITIDEEF